MSDTHRVAIPGLLLLMATTIVVLAVRVGDPAEVRVNVYPSEVFRGKVIEIATVAPPVQPRHSATKSSGGILSMSEVF
jgi:hypothetical protein